MDKLMGFTHPEESSSWRRTGGKIRIVHAQFDFLLQQIELTPVTTPWEPNALPWNGNNENFGMFVRTI
jgi:hypothetical protein